MAKYIFYVNVNGMNNSQAEEQVNELKKQAKDQAFFDLEDKVLYIKSADPHTMTYLTSVD